MKRLARRISDIVFAMIKTQSPYRKEKALENMRRRESPYLPKENEGEMAISIDEISFESLPEIDEPCLTLAHYFNLSEGKLQEKITHLLQESVVLRSSSKKGPLRVSGSRHIESDIDITMSDSDVLSKSK